MWYGLTDSEVGLLRMSVGYGRRQSGRPLSPTEVGLLLKRAVEHGASRRECSEKVDLSATNIGRFLRLTSLPFAVQGWIDWGAPKDFVGFSSAAELARLPDDSDQRTVAEAVLSQRLTSKEVRQVVQLRTRSLRPIAKCVQEIVGMRTVVERRYVFMGAVIDEDVVAALSRLSQLERNLLLSDCLTTVGLEGASGRLGPKIFTLVGGGDFGQSMEQLGKESIEHHVRSHIRRSIEGGSATG